MKTRNALLHMIALDCDMHELDATNRRMAYHRMAQSIGLEWPRDRFVFNKIMWCLDAVDAYFNDDRRTLNWTQCLFVEATGRAGPAAHAGAPSVYDGLRQKGLVMLRQFTLPAAVENIPAGSTLIVDTERALLAFRHNDTDYFFIGRSREIRGRRDKKVVDYEDCTIVGTIVNWFEGSPGASQTRH